MSVLHARNGEHWQQNRCGEASGRATNDGEATCTACRAIIDATKARAWVEPSALARRVIEAYRRVPLSMEPSMTWRMSKENCQAIARAMGMPDGDEPDPDAAMTMFGMPVELVESDEILLVVKV